MSISRITKGVSDILRSGTLAAAEEIRKKDVDLIIPAGASTDIVAMAQAATALVVRCFTGKIRIHADDSFGALRRALTSEAVKLRASDRLEFIPTAMGPWRLAFGCVVDGAVCGDCSGWTARINGIFQTRMPAAGCAVTFTAACMVAKLFNAAVLGRATHLYEPWDFCLMRFRLRPPTHLVARRGVDLGRFTLLGAGAIGTAVGYVMLCCGVVADVLVIDSQGYEEPNLETCMLLDFEAATGLAPKARFLADALNVCDIVATSESRRIESADDPLLRREAEAFVCGVDNPETRLILDDVPGVLLNAGLGDSSYDAGFVLWTTHTAGGTRLSDIYAPSAEARTARRHDHVPDEFKDECSRMRYLDTALSIPFTALAAGSLLTAGLYQRALGVRPDCNLLQLDVFGKQQRFTVA